jgi:uncharacterized damage-inducible protein DinB
VEPPSEFFPWVYENVPSLATIIDNLARAQSELMRAADGIPAEQWKTRPAEGRWSAGELIGHLTAIERAILSRTDKVLQKPPKSVPFYKRFHVPMMIVEARVIRRKAPSALEPQMAGEKEEMLAELRGVRERTLAFIEETRGRDLSEYLMPHPFLGTLDGYDWLQFIASHEIRHMKQMREIAGSYRKP